MGKGIMDYQVGEQFSGYGLVKNVTKGMAKNNSAFLTVVIGDKTGEIDFKVWGATEEDELFYKAGIILKLVGGISDYQGRKQFNLQDCSEASVDDDVTVEDLLESAPVSGDRMFELIEKVATEEIKNDNIQDIVLAILGKYEDDLKVYPAATSMHHAYVGGLAYHKLGMLKIAMMLARLYPNLNKGLLYAGVILHDIGKIHEYAGVIDKSRTVPGQLIGHISMISEEIGHVAKSLGVADKEEVMLLQHMVLSHHGRLDWGSPVRPLIIEAEVLHFIDSMDAKMDMLRGAMGKVEPGNFSGRLFGLENRSFYKPVFDVEETQEGEE